MISTRPGSGRLAAGVWLKFWFQLNTMLADIAEIDEGRPPVR